MTTLRYGTHAAAVGILSLVHALGCGDSSRATGIDPNTGSGGSAGSDGAEDGGSGGETPAPGGLVPFECDGSIPPGPTVYVDENGYWRLGPNDPAGSYCEGGDLIFYDQDRNLAPIAWLHSEADIERFATALETTGCNTVVGSVDVDPWRPEDVITNVDALAGLVNVRYGFLGVNTRQEIESIVGLANVRLVDDVANVLGSYTGGSNEWVVELLEAVSEQQTYPEEGFTCPIADPDPEESVFDPTQVYIRGHLGPVDSGMALSPASDPSQLRAGFTDGLGDVASCWIRPTDGKLIYWHFEQGIFVWQADPWAIDAVHNHVYPTNAMGNDEPIETECALPEAEFFITPGTGEIVYACVDSAATAFCPDGVEHCVYYTEASAAFPVAADRLLLHVGNDGRSLVQGPSPGSPLMVQDSSGWGTSVTPASGTVVPSQADAVRATADGFLVLDRSRAQADTLGELWEVGNDGVASRLGVYPAAPDDISVYSDPGSCVLDGDQVAYCRAPDNEGTGNSRFITRHEVDALEATVVFDQELWQLQLPQLPITGP